MKVRCWPQAGSALTQWVGGNVLKNANKSATFLSPYDHPLKRMVVPGTTSSGRRMNAASVISDQTISDFFIAGVGLLLNYLLALLERHLLRWREGLSLDE